MRYYVFTLIISLFVVQPALAHTLVVTHATHFFDPKHVTEAGLIQVVQSFRQQHNPVVFLYGATTLQSSQPQHAPLVLSSPSDLILESNDGAFELPNATETQFTLAGGYLSLCLGRTIRDIVLQTSHTGQSGRYPGKPIQIHLALDAIYLDHSLGQVILSDLNCAPGITLPHGVFTLAEMKRRVPRATCFTRFIAKVLSPEFDPRAHQVTFRSESSVISRRFGQGNTKFEVRF